MNVVAENEPDVWWRFPVLVLSALQNGLLEEVLVIGYLLTRLRRLDVSPFGRWRSRRCCAAPTTCTRASAASPGNAVMGIIFGVLFLRWRRATPMIIAHTLIDAVAFIGYALLVGHVSWLL